MYDIIFNATTRIPDPNPGEQLISTEWDQRETWTFQAEWYVASLNISTNRTSAFNWRRAGRILKQDGNPRADGRQGSRGVPEDQVPAEVKRALALNIAKRGESAIASIQSIIDRAAEQVPQGVSR